MTNRESEDIKSEINDLKNEIVSIKEMLDNLSNQKLTIEQQERLLKSRIDDICGKKDCRSTVGIIEKLELELKECTFPRYDDLRRIVSVTEKTIGLKYDKRSFDCVTRYNRENGWVSRSKTAYNAIDAQKSLEIWRKHNDNKSR